MKNSTLIKQLHNERGVLTVDFLFAFVLILGFTAILFSLTLTLTVAELAQYMTYASARAQNAGHHRPSDQNKIALDKFEEIRNNPVLSVFFTGNWFGIEGPFIDDQANVTPEYASPAGGTSVFWGTSLRFTARILDLQIPFFGSTAPESDGSGEGFKTTIGSYLGREVTSAHCYENMVRLRWTYIRDLPVSGADPYTTSTPTSSYVPIADNGC